MSTNRVREPLIDLRSTVEWLRSEGLLLESDVEVNPDLDITGVQKHLDGSCPILFNNVEEYPHLRAVTNLFANTTVMNKIFGWANDTERTRLLAHAITHPVNALEIGQDEAPVQEHVITDDLDVNKWILAIKHTQLETEFTIGSGMSVVVGKYFKDGSHIGYNR
ncbi:MAG: UbiD family decarboxylase, partial [Desulfobacteraceae bacterium]